MEFFLFVVASNIVGTIIGLTLFIIVHRLLFPDNY